MSLTETGEQTALRAAVAQPGSTYGDDDMVTKARAHGDMTELYRVTGQPAPVSAEMIPNFVAQHSLGLPKSY